MELRKTFQFEAAHLLPHLPEKHKCRRLHGHSFMTEIIIEGDCDPKLGWVLDYADMIIIISTKSRASKTLPVRMWPFGFGKD